MTIGVRTEDAFGNPVPGWHGEATVRCHGAPTGAGVVALVDGYGTLQLHSEVRAPAILGCGRLPY
eukprot:3726913-Prymnesium_polylepis.1